MRRSMCSVLFVFTLAAGAAWPQAKMSAQAQKTYALHELDAGGDYVLVSACKNHDCAENNVVLLYSSGQDVVYGKVYQRGASTLIGAPPPAVAADLERLWQTEWRSQPK